MEKNRYDITLQSTQNVCCSDYSNAYFLIQNYIVLTSEETKQFDIFDFKLDDSAIESLNIRKKNHFDKCQILRATAPDYTARLGTVNSINERVLLYSCFQSEKEVDVILNINVTGICKIWLNGKIIMIFPRGGRRYVTVRLEVFSIT